MKFGKIFSFSIKYFFKEYLGLILKRDDTKHELPWSLTFKDMLRIYLAPRYTKTSVKLFGFNIKMVDPPSFQFLWEEIFERQIYKFECSKSKPYIIDCGANIGLSVIYFKKLYPEAEIIAFEPDPEIFEVLCNNIAAFHYNDIQLMKKAVWSEETKLFFIPDGSDGGRIDEDGNSLSRCEVETVRLRDYLKRQVDFLKIDIEGAEIKVLQDCSDLLLNVERLFVEYHSFIKKDQNLDILLRIISDANFRYYISHVGIESPHPAAQVININRIDNQLNIYAYRNNEE